MYELLTCEKYLGLSRETLRKMPVWERKYRINFHNDLLKIEEDNIKSKRNSKKKGGN